MIWIAAYFFLSAVISTYIHNEWEHDSEWERWLSCFGYALLSPVWMLLYPMALAARWVIAKTNKLAMTRLLRYLRDTIKQLLDL